MRSIDVVGTPGDRDAYDCMPDFFLPNIGWFMIVYGTLRRFAVFVALGSY